jgi:hypothetical protein
MGARSYSEVERDLERGEAKGGTRDAWHRVERALPGDFDRDGR